MKSVFGLYSIPVPEFCEVKDVRMAFAGSLLVGTYRGGRSGSYWAAASLYEILLADFCGLDISLPG